MRLSEQPVRQWENLIGTAVLGLDRTLPDDVGVGQNAQQDFLKELCVLALYVQAGKTMSKGPVADGGVFDDEEKICSSDATACLRKILYGEYKGLLLEWSGIASRNGLKAPPECLPELLEYARSVGAQERIALHEIVGNRGMWLAKQNPAWTNLFAEATPDEEVWHAGMRQERLHFIESLRLKNPARALALLRQTWQEEDPDDRALFVGALAAGLSLDDEAFLEECLDDKRKHVRTTAADLLARISGSQLSKRMTEALFGLIRYTPGKKGLLKSKKPTLDVELPDTKNRMLLRDGIDPRKAGKLGPGAVALANMVAAVPLDEWKRLDMDTNTVITSALAGEFGTSFAVGFTQAAVRQASVEWAKVIIGRCHLFKDKASQAGSMEIDLAGPMKCLNPEDREAAVIDYVERYSGSQYLDVIHELLVAMDHPWSDGFSGMAFRIIQKHFVKNLGNYNLRRPVLEKFVLRLSPCIVEEAGQGWPVQSNRFTSSDEEMVHRLTSILQFRKCMSEELNNGS